MDYEALGRRIRKQRKLMKRTQEDLAAVANVSTSYIGHIERGIKCCSIDTLVSIANALEVTPDFLLQDSITVPASPPLPSPLLDAIATVLREHDVL